MIARVGNVNIGILSDTHGVLHQAVLDLFEGVDAIFHAGDIGDDDVLSRLKKIAPVMAVRGNMDSPPLSYDVPVYRVSRLADKNILITHRVGNPMKPCAELQERLLQVRPAVVVFGHTHHSFNQWINGILFFNPGTAGKKSHGHPLSVGFIEMDADEINGRIIYFDHE